MNDQTGETRLDVAVIGAGFAGLGTAARLQSARGIDFAVIEQGTSVGEFWKGTYDRVRLHSPDHDLPHDGGLRKGYPMLLARDEILSYFKAYAEHHKLADRMRFETRVERVRDEGGDHPWAVETTRGTLRARYLVVATSVNRIPKRASIEGLDAFGERAIHSASYRNPTPYRGRSVLVVGSGNSGAEIALDLVENGARSVAMWVRAPRHFLPLEATLTLYRTFRTLGQMSEKKLAAGHALTRGTPAFDREVKLRDLPMKLLSADLSRFGIRKPKTGPVHGIVYEHRLPVMDVGAIARIRDGSIRVIDGNVRPLRGFTATGVTLGDREERFDDVILATGYEPGLEHFLGESELLGLRYGHRFWPITDGRCRSTVRRSVFFPGFDPTPLGGISLGRWGWEVGDRIAEELATRAR